MRGVILAGGLGMRLRPYTTILPKPLLPVGDRPVIEQILRRWAAIGIERVDLAVAHLGELIRVYLAEATDLPKVLDLHWHWEDKPLGTAGALRLIPDLDETFLVMNGDILTTLDFDELLAAHRRSGDVLTVAMREKTIDIDLGVIETDGNRITGYSEKPTLRYEVSMGVYVYEPAALDHLPAGPCQFPDLVQRLVAAGQPVGAFRTDAHWFDIGTFAEYERALEFMAAHPVAFDPRVPPEAVG